MSGADRGLTGDLRRAGRYRFLHLLLGPPAPGRRVRLWELGREAGGEEGESLDPLLAAEDEAVVEEAFRLLGPAGPVPVTASDYVEDGYADKGPILGDIAGFYRAFGFSPGIPGTPDHFAILFEFLSLLALKQAWARQEGDREQVSVARRAEEDLLAEHVHPFLARFARRLESFAPPGGAYLAVARYVAAFAERAGGERTA